MLRRGQVAAQQFQGQGQSAHGVGQSLGGRGVAPAGFGGQLLQEGERGIVLEGRHVLYLASPGEGAGKALVAAGEQVDAVRPTAAQPFGRLGIPHVVNDQEQPARADGGADGLLAGNGVGQGREIQAQGLPPGGQRAHHVARRPHPGPQHAVAEMGQERPVVAQGYGQGGLAHPRPPFGGQGQALATGQPPGQRLHQFLPPFEVAGHGWHAGPDRRPLFGGDDVILGKDGVSSGCDVVDGGGDGRWVAWAALAAGQVSQEVVEILPAAQQGGYARDSQGDHGQDTENGLGGLEKQADPGGDGRQEQQEG